MNDQPVQSPPPILGPHTQKPPPSKWQILLMAAPMLTYFSAVGLLLLFQLLVVQDSRSSLFWRFVADASLLVIFGAGLISLIGPIFGLRALFRSLDPAARLHPVTMFFLWLGVVVLNVGVTFAVCASIFSGFVF
jgi:hypothetical protein